MDDEPIAPETWERFKADMRRETLRVRREAFEARRKWRDWTVAFLVRRPSMPDRLLTFGALAQTRDEAIAMTMRWFDYVLRHWPTPDVSIRIVAIRRQPAHRPPS